MIGLGGANLWESSILILVFQRKIMGVLISRSDPNRNYLVRIATNPYFLAGPGIQYCL